MKTFAGRKQWQDIQSILPGYTKVPGDGTVIMYQ